MTVPLVIGVGAVGLHAARQLEATPGVERVLLADTDRRRAEMAAEALTRVSVVEWPREALPDETSVVAIALPSRADPTAAALAVEAGLPCASSADDADAIRRLFDLSPLASAAGSPVVIGAGVAPGLSEVLAAFARDQLDQLHELDVARFGTSGPACRKAAAHAGRGRGVESARGTLAPTPGRAGRRLVYFPDPVGPRDCRPVVSGVPLLAQRLLPQAERITVRHALPSFGSSFGRAVWGRRRGPRLGALHVDVRGAQGPTRRALTFGAVDVMANMAGAALALATAAVSGLGPIEAPPAGVRGFAELAPPRALLAELAMRGVRAARFEGRT